MKKIICPICGAQKTTNLYSEQSLYPDYSTPELRTHTSKYVICKECGFIYIYPRPKASLLDKYYSTVNTAQNTSETIKKYKKAEYVNTVKFILKNIPVANGKIVDIGAASGSLLNMLSKDITGELIGLEPSEECCKFAAKNYKFRMLKTTLEEIDLKTERLYKSADLVISCHCWEHIHNPVLFLKKACRMLQEGGYCYLEVPSTKLLAEFSEARYGRNIHSLHLNHFTVASAFAAAKRGGLCPVMFYDDIGANYPSLKIVLRKQTVFQYSKELFNKQNTLSLLKCEAAFNRIKQISDSTTKKIVLWGAGEDLFYIMSRYKKIARIKNVILIDKNKDKQNKMFLGKKILSLESINKLDVGQVIVTPSSQMLQMNIVKDIKKYFPGVKHTLLFPANG